MTDGVTHINVYGRGATPLGRLLSNFAHTPFMYENVMFASVEAWWYWRDCHDPKLPPLWGIAAKKLGQEIRGKTFRPPPPTREELKKVYIAKVVATPHLYRMLIESQLPFDHYYFYGGRRVDTPHRWTGELWTELRDELRRKYVA